MSERSEAGQNKAGRLETNDGGAETDAALVICNEGRERGGSGAERAKGRGKGREGRETGRRRRRRRRRRGRGQASAGGDGDDGVNNKHHLAISLTHTHTHTLSLSLSLALSLSLSLALSPLLCPLGSPTGSLSVVHSVASNKMRCMEVSAAGTGHRNRGTAHAEITLRATNTDSNSTFTIRAGHFAAFSSQGITRASVTHCNWSDTRAPMEGRRWGRP